MNIVMMTNTYLPHVGGVARSVASFTEAFRHRGHRVLVVAPTFENMPAEEIDVVRVPALENFNNSGFSVRVPIPGLLAPLLDAFRPDVVHSHHPFLLGDTALRTATLRNLPLVFTHHTMYERYTHYLPGDSDILKRFAGQLATEYANLCDHVIAPSESLAQTIRQRGVTTPIQVIPTGIDARRFGTGDGPAARRRHGIPEDAFVVGHVGRLAPEKNLGFLAGAVAAFLQRHVAAHFLLIGTGPLEGEVRQTFEQARLSGRLHTPEGGVLAGQELADAYHAMDVFVFASQTETQGMVVAEAMTAGVPVVAVDAPGVREVIEDGRNGRLLPREDEAEFVASLEGIADLPPPRRRQQRQAARRTAKQFELRRCADEVLALYSRLVQTVRPPRPSDDSPWQQTLRLMETEWNLWAAYAGAAAKSLGSPPRE